MHLHRRFFSLWLPLLFLALPCWGAPAYTFIDLGDGGCLRLEAGGTCLGFVRTGATMQAVLFAQGQPPQLLGFLPGGMISQANAAANDRIVGDSRTGERGTITHAFVFENGAIRDLGTLGGDPGQEASAASVNGVQALGRCGTLASPTPCLWDLVVQTGPVALPTLGGAFGRGLGLNTVGVAVGASDTDTGQTHATLWGLGAPRVLTPQEDSGSVAFDINDTNIVVGQVGTQAFRWSSVDGLETFAPLSGDVFARLLAVNNDGQAVGISFGDGPPPGPPRPTRAVRLTGDALEDLNTLTAGLPVGAVLRSAMGISAGGIIGGIYTLGDDPLGHAYLLIPTPAAPERRER